MNKVKSSKILVRFLKSKVLKVIAITTVFPVDVMSKLTTFHGIKGDNLFRLQHFFDKHMDFRCKNPYLYEMGKPFLFKESHFIRTW